VHKPGVLVIHNRYRQAGGEGAVVRAEIALLRQHGHRVMEFVRENAAIDRFGPARRASLALSTTWNHAVYADVRRLLRRERPAVAHCHNLVPLISPAPYYACRDEGVPVVQSLHNFRLRCPAGTMFRDRQVCADCSKGLLHGVARGCYRNSRAQTAAAALMLLAHRALGTFEQAVDTYSAPSVFCAEQLAGQDIPRKKIAVRPNFLLNDPGARHASGDFVLFVGRVCEEKGVRQLLQAWRHLPHVPLVVAGDGPLRHEAQRTAPANVSFTGTLPPAETMQRMKAARFLVFPSVGYETFGMAVLEAAACGVATVGARLGAIPELVQEGRTGLLFDPQDIDELAAKVEWAWWHPVSMNAMGAAARRQYQQRYSAHTAYESLMKLYGSVQHQFETESETSGAVA
jgi:glycosyltransferase involved in cell wall biosynthesis